jgi:hypothetical protein
MKVPTTGTSVFAAQAPASTNIYTSNFPVDATLLGRTDDSGDNARMWSRLMGRSPFLTTSTTAAENNSAMDFDSNVRVVYSGVSSGDPNNQYRMPWLFARAPSFMDVVCYTGTGSARTVAHNLAAVPELMIVRSRAGNNWLCYNATIGNTSALILNLNNGVFTGQATSWNSTTPTASVFSVGTSSGTNASATTYVAYLFATCPGVSKVGSYTGTGATQVINCGFTSGARFVLIKSTSTSGDWYVWDSARGIVAGNDPYVRLNVAANQVTNTDWVDTAATGFELSNAGGNLANSNGVSYIFLAIA